MIGQLFTTYRFTWWQIAIFKTCLLSVGLVVGAHFYEYVQPYILPLIILALVTGVYMWYVAIRQTWV